MFSGKAFTTLTYVKWCWGTIPSSGNSVGKKNKFKCSYWKSQTDKRKTWVSVMRTKTTTRRLSASPELLKPPHSPAQCSYATRQRVGCYGTVLEACSTVSQERAASARLDMVIVTYTLTTKTQLIFVFIG